MTFENTCAPCPLTRPLTHLRAALLASLLGSALMMPALAAPGAAAQAPGTHTGLAFAAPAAADTQDPLLQLLVERGVLQAGRVSMQPAVALAHQARDLAADAVIAAMAFLDLPYAQGGATVEGGFDCSGFTRHVFKNALGLLLPRSAEQQAQAQSLLPVAADELKPGDLVFFNTVRKAFSHVGIYIGGGRFVHSPRVGAVVRLENMHQTYWATRFDGARRPTLADNAPSRAAEDVPR